jgi:hypothetical protein
LPVNVLEHFTPVLFAEDELLLHLL